MVFGHFAFNIEMLQRRRERRPNRRQIIGSGERGEIKRQTEKSRERVRGSDRETFNH